MKIIDNFLWVFLLFITNVSIAQEPFLGMVTDAATEDPLIGATITLGDEGVLSDFSGAYSLSTSAEEDQEVSFSYVGYTTLTMSLVELKARNGLVALEESSTILQTATITGSKFERKLTEAVSSIEVINSDFADGTNTQALDDLLQKIPGVQILDGQANIRGGSGFSFGAGTRVMLLLNDIPFVQPDAGYTNWSDLPVETLSQVEVLKGSASALYGSAALNGIVNVRTKYATSKPETKLSVSYGRYLSPKDKIKQWWGDGSATDTIVPHELALSISHRRKLTKDLDLVFGAHYYDQDSYNLSTNQNRYRLSTSLKYRITDRLNVSLSALVNRLNVSSFFLWDDAGKTALQPIANGISERENLRFIIDPTISYYDKYDNSHKLKMRYFDVDNKVNLGQSNSSKNFYTEYQFQRKLNVMDMVFTGGLVNQYLTSDSELFSNAIFNASNYATYAQLESKPLESVILSLGTRYEYNSLNVPTELSGDTISRSDLSDGDLISKLGLNWSATEYTFLRTSFGQGYRFPTVVERFITTEFASFKIFPNPTLLPEFGWTAELGIKQGFRAFGFEGFLDLALFNQRYRNMMEFTFQTINGESGFQSQNVGDTQITGAELSLMGKGAYGDIGLSIYGGITLLDPVYQDLESNKAVKESLSTTGDQQENVLKYRSKKLLKVDVELEYKFLRLGVNVQSASHVVNIDKLLGLVGQIEGYRSKNNMGYMVVSPRLSGSFKNWKTSLICNNILNEEYTVRPGLIEAPRNVSLRMDYVF